MAKRLKSVGGGVASDSAAQTEQPSPLGSTIGPREFAGERASYADTESSFLVREIGSLLALLRDAIERESTLVDLARKTLPPTNETAKARDLLFFLNDSQQGVLELWGSLGGAVEEFVARVRLVDGSGDNFDPVTGRRTAQEAGHA